MKFELMGYVYSTSVYDFIEFDLKDLKTDWENTYAIIFKRYNNEDFSLLDNTLHSIEEKERPFTMNDVSSRLDNGHMLFIAKKDNKIIGFFWVAMNYIEIPFFHASMYLGKENAVDYNSYIVVKHRGKNINAGLKAYAFYDLKQQGYTRVFGYIKTTNKSSIKANKHFGFRTIGQIRTKIILTLEFRYADLPKDMIVFHGGILRLWKGLFRKVKGKLFSLKSINLLKKAGASKKQPT